MADIILWDGVYVRQNLIDYSSLVAKMFMINVIRPDVCHECDIKLGGGHLLGECGCIPSVNAICELVTVKCDNFIASATLFHEVMLDGVAYWRLPRDSIYKLQEYFGVDYTQLTIEDRRQVIPFSSQVASNWVIDFPRMYDYQATGVDDLLAAAGEFGQRGSINAQPRTGKTLMMLAAVWQIGLKTIIMANEHILLQNFLDDAAEFSNAEFAKTAKHERDDYLLVGTVPVIGVCTKLEDFEKFDIALCIPHIFYKNDALYEAVRTMFSVLVLDEVHRANSSRWSAVLDGLVVTDYLTASATFNRKDLLNFVMEHQCGPPVSFVDAVSVSPVCHLHYADGWVPEKDFSDGKRALYYYRWSLTYGPKVVEIAKQVLLDLKAGHKVLLPLLYIDDIQFYADLFKRLGLRVGVIVGKANRKQFSGYETDITKVVAKAKAGDYDVTVAIRSKIQAGVTCWRWSALYVVAGTSNEYNLYQETKRVSSPPPPEEFKPAPVLRYWLDNCTLPKKWLDGLLKNMFDVYDYQWADDDYARAKRLVHSRSLPDYFDFDGEIPKTKGKAGKNLKTPAQIAEHILGDTPTVKKPSTRRNKF